MSNLLGRLLTRNLPGKSQEAFPVLNPSVNDLAEDGSAGVSQRGYESRAFALWFDELSKLGGKHLVDFGAMQPQNVNFFCDQHMGVSIVGLDVTQDLNQQLEQFSVPQPFDAALCWEYPNYLDVAGLQQMGAWLAKHVRPGGLVMLSLAIKTPYSDQPSNHRIVDHQRIERQAAPVGEGRAQRYASGELSKYWPEFDPLRSFLLRSGMQEYVLRRRHEPVT